jgi:predicted transcriptional regulator
MVTSHGLGPLEMKVLGLLGARASSVADVRRGLRAAGDDLAYTTVMTVLVRLHEKGFVTRERRGNRYEYVRSAEGPRAGEGLIARVRRALFRDDRVRPFVALLDDDSLTREDLRELRRLVDERLKGARR